MSHAEMVQKLADLISLTQECEWVEFKTSFADSQQIGEYLSALSNSAALHRQPYGYIVWGVEDSSHNIIGTSFKPRQTKGAGNEDLEPWLARLLAPRMEFKIYELVAGDNKPVVLFEVQAANSSPVAFAGREYVRVGSHKKPLMEFKEKERELWRLLSAPDEDWSRQTCEGAGLKDLDPQAIEQARKAFKIKNPKLSVEVDGWDDQTFLNKAKLCIDGRITNTTIILLGKDESTHFLSPSVAQITWVLKGKGNIDRDYRHFGPPFLLAVDALFANVRNLTLRHLPDGTLFPIEVSQYDPWVLREILHNCIAHQDYSLNGRINVVEVEDDSILFTNLGHFLPGSVEMVIQRDQPEENYRNRFLVDAMVNLNMIDTIGSGIRRSFGIQRDRNFPMPSYDLTEKNRVKVKVIGQILDANYTRMLMSQTNLDLMDVIALDKVQKGQTLSDAEFKSLKNKCLIEGRRPQLRVSAHVAKVTDTVEDYLRRRGIDKAYCEKMVIDFLAAKTTACRADIIRLLAEKLSDALSEEQKRNFIRNLLQEMRKKGSITVEGRGTIARWGLANGDPNVSN